MAQTLHSLPEGYRALVIGARGAIGAALLDLLRADPRCATALGLHRQSDPALDLLDEAGVAAAARQLTELGPFQLIVNAAGRLHGPGLMPEKKLGDLRLESLQAIFAANTFGPALLLHHFTPLLDRHCGRLAMLSAKVGSIGDNRLGGWYGYRASKAALNMLIRTAGGAATPAPSSPHCIPAPLHRRCPLPFAAANSGARRLPPPSC
jgi:NAD(P)-dependent dehydrogenase (short-subunit alcohol dehydrogenase family)